jgi:hypothetical protein
MISISLASATYTGRMSLSLKPQMKRSILKLASERIGEHLNFYNYCAKIITLRERTLFVHS